MKFQDTLHINASAEKIWSTVAHDFANLSRWASSIESSGINHDAPVPNGADVGGRVCRAPGFGDIKETFLHYDEGGKTFTYFAEGGPFFMKSAQNTWTVISESDSTAKVTFAAEMVMHPPFNWLMAVPMRLQINRIIKNTAEELKHYIEKGEIHPRKAGKV
ncbi:MAG: SRPBCC family protein [Chloroflexota bacterium]